jgi:hypothetical protein
VPPYPHTTTCSYLPLTSALTHLCPLESSTGVLISTERAARKGGELPEDIGRETALQLLEEVCKGGVIDSTHQPLVLMLMVLGPEDVSKVMSNDIYGYDLTPLCMFVSVHAFLTYYSYALSPICVPDLTTMIGEIRGPDGPGGGGIAAAAGGFWRGVQSKGGQGE